MLLNMKLKLEWRFLSVKPIKIALVNIAMYCSKAESRVPVVVGGGWVVVVQTNNHVKPTSKLLWVAFGYVTYIT